MPEPPPPITISNEQLGTMTPQQLSRSGIALRLKIEYPIGTGKEHEFVLCPTKDLKKHRGSAPHVFTYTEFDGVCQAHAATQDPRLEGLDALIAIERFREKAFADGVSLMTTKIAHEGATLGED